MVERAGDDLFLVFNSIWASVFAKLEPPRKISRSPLASVQCIKQLRRHFSYNFLIIMLCNEFDMDEIKTL